MRHVRTSFFVGLIALLAALPQAGRGLEPTGAPPEPRGFYVLQSGRSDALVSDALLSNPNLEGVVLRRLWTQLNPAQDKYDWRYFDREIRRAKDHGKKVQLIVFSGVSTPAWVYTAGARSFMFSDARKSPVPLSMPVPWDEVMLNKYERFVRAMGKRYDGEPAVTLVHAGGPTRFSVEFHLPREILDLPDFSRDKIVQAWQRAVQFYAEAFPHKLISLNVSPVVRGGDGVTKQIIQSAQGILGPRMTLQHDALAAKTSAASTAHQNITSNKARGVRIGFEMLSPSKEPRFGGDFLPAVDIGRQAGAQYLNIYAPDVPSLTAPY